MDAQFIEQERAQNNFQNHKFFVCFGPLLLHIMQSIFRSASRRETLGEHAVGDRRDGDLKMGWTKPPPSAFPMGIDPPVVPREGFIDVGRSQRAVLPGWLAVSPMSSQGIDDHDESIRKCSQ
jgi:hypothetical protein